MSEDRGDGEEARWLTYRQLAEARGIAIESAAKLVLRRKWRRQVGNDGAARILVPLAGLEMGKVGTPDIHPDVPRDGPPDIPPDITSTISALEQALSTIREQLERERGRGDAAEARVEAARTEARAAENKAEAARAEAQEATVRAAVAEAKLAAAEAALAEARTPWPIRVVRALRSRGGKGFDAERSR